MCQPILESESTKVKRIHGHVRDKCLSRRRGEHFKETSTEGKSQDAFSTGQYITVFWFFLQPNKSDSNVSQHVCVNSSKTKENGQTPTKKLCCYVTHEPSNKHRKKGFNPQLIC